MSKEMIDKVLAGDLRATARLLRWVDDGLGQARRILKRLYGHTGRARIIGITGNPGAGKSTLTDQLIRHYRSRNLRVAVIAIDPTSPFSGGAILGDRIRMQEHATDEGVFIRSFATRGHLGGLTSTTGDVVQVLDAAGWQVIIVETVGVGQDEVEVQRLAQSTVVVMAPGMGDEIQAIKAGVLEIADIFVVNKADREGADRTVRELQMMLDMAQVTATELAHHGAGHLAAVSPQAQEAADPQGWVPPVLKTTALRGEGLPELCRALDEHERHFRQACADPQFRRARLRQQFLDIYRRTLVNRGWSYLMHEDHLRQILDRLQAGESDPYTLAEEAVAALGGP